MAQKQKPVHDFCLGRIRAAIWANTTKDGDIWFNITLTRRYQDGGEWKDTSHFRRDDLPIVSKVADMAYAWIWEKSKSSDDCEEEMVE